ncbi:hemerythrin domain-containing protein [Clostridium cylindrosporum]|uniref:Hemerythrin HHE cation binding domain protein n=1 Tax=Clostridium cylindrosporum DSM 605 TaxID=1121307 RepID=A0A0J8DA19_CLOCY|nr:hemerythrin domain-containing protein [Clostridium cylindrosporum]KMT21164.1 hemerythrin HHE cation binding domain protein [Clostridium cylindrosporum DSM 605]
MVNINNLERQHEEIKELASKIKVNINSNNLEENIDVLVKDLNILAGKLSIHMSLEDKFLYPELINSKEDKLKEIAKQYSYEMGNINSGFKNYKSKFNTKTKILNNIEEFSKESKEIIKLLESRISKEDTHLYPKVKSL